MADDLRDFGGAFTSGVAKTPHLDRLMKRGVRFQRAFAQYPVCNPSRTSMLLGLRCEQTGIVGNQQFFRDTMPDAVTFPQLLRQHGWTTRSYGKILHAANTGESVRGAWLDVGKSWDHAEILPAQSPHRRGEFRNLTGGKLAWCEIGILEGNDDEQPDGATAVSAIRAMEELTGAGKPWMVAAGFHRPHDPFHAPRKYFDLYPKGSLQLRSDLAVSSNAAPMAISSGWVADFARFTEEDRLDFFRAYLAGVSFMDAQVGRLLDTLDRLKLWENTLVIFMGDHGYHLGERGWWNKSTLFDRSCRAPLIIAAPGMKGAQVCRSPVEFVDLYPTVADFCGVKAPHALVGQSLRPLLAAPGSKFKEAGFTLVGRGQRHFGRSVATERWRFTRWSDGTLELYDHDVDPEETQNLSLSSSHSNVVEELRRKLDSLPPWPATPAVHRPTGGGKDLAPGQSASPATNPQTEVNGVVARETLAIAGWQVHVSKKLIETEPDQTARALAGLRKMLEEIVIKLPGPAVAELKKVPLYFSTAYNPGRSGAEFHPDAGWLRANRRDPAMARAVEFSGVSDFEAEMRRMPNFPLHELAHAYHHRVLAGGFDNPDIAAAYKRASSGGRYERVERSFGEGNGRPNTFERAYAMSSPMEYFAEATEAYFVRNDFYPFSRDELQKHDPDAVVLLRKLWGVPEGH